MVWSAKLLEINKHNNLPTNFENVTKNVNFLFFALQCEPYNEIISLFSGSNFTVKPLLAEMDQPLLKPKMYTYFNLYMKFYIKLLKCLVIRPVYL